MLRLPSFRHLEPKSLSEAAKMLRELGSHAAILAGGTDLVPRMKRALAAPEALVDIRRLSKLREVKKKDGSISIGALTTIADLSSHAMLQRYTALIQASRLIATPAIRNMATVGGNLLCDTRCFFYNQSDNWRRALGFCLKSGNGVCHAAPQSKNCLGVNVSDLAPALLAMSARLRIKGHAKEREIPLEELYQNNGREHLRKSHDEIITEVLLPTEKSWQSIYFKLRRRGAFDFSSLSVAIALRRETSGAVDDCRIVLGSVGSEPVLAMEAARALLGRRMDSECIEEASQTVLKYVRGVENIDFSASYRRKMAKVYVLRGLKILAAIK